MSIYSCLRGNCLRSSCLKNGCLKNGCLKNVCLCLLFFGNLIIGNAAAGYTIIWTIKYEAPQENLSIQPMQPEDLDRKPENELPLEEKEKSGAPADETKKITVSPSSDGETYKCLKVLTDKGKSRRDKRKAVANLVETYTAEGANKKVSDAALAVIQIAAGVRPIGASEMKAVISDQSGNNVTDLVNDSLGDDEAKGIADNLLEEMKDYEIPRDIRNRLSHGKEIPSDARKEKPYTKCIAIKQGELQGDTASSAKTAKAIMSNLGDLNVPEGIRKKVEVFVALAGVYDPKHTKEITVLAPEETDSSKSDFDPSDRDSVETSNGEGG